MCHMYSGVKVSVHKYFKCYLFLYIFFVTMTTAVTFFHLLQILMEKWIGEIVLVLENL